MRLKRSSISFDELVEFARTNTPPPGWEFAEGNDKLEVYYVSPNDECLIWDAVEHGPVRHDDFLQSEYVADPGQAPLIVRERITVRRHMINGIQVRFTASSYKIVGGTGVIERRYIGDEVWYSRVIICSREEGERSPALLDSYGQYVRECEQEQPIPNLVMA
jgi:hypothetical protein